MAILEFKIRKTDYPMPETEKALRKVGTMWRKNARISLTQQNRVNTGALYDSMPVDIIETADEYIVDITPQVHYWEFVDQGVQGATKNIYPEQSKSDFKFGSGSGGSGLRGAIDKWVVKKGLEGTRDAKGRFLPRKSITYAISSAVWNRGLKPALFITRTRANIEKHVTKTIAPAMSKDIANAMEKELNK